MENSECSAATHAMQQKAKRSYEFIYRCCISGAKDRIQKTLKSSNLTLLPFELMVRLKKSFRIQNALSPGFAYHVGHRKQRKQKENI